MSVYKVNKSANLNNVKNFVNGVKSIFLFYFCTKMYFFISDFSAAVILALVCFYLSVYIYDFFWGK